MFQIKQKKCHELRMKRDASKLPVLRCFVLTTCDAAQRSYLTWFLHRVYLKQVGLQQVMAIMLHFKPTPWLAPSIRHLLVTCATQLKWSKLSAQTLSCFNTWNTLSLWALKEQVLSSISFMFAVIWHSGLRPDFTSLHFHFDLYLYNFVTVHAYAVV